MNHRLRVLCLAPLLLAACRGASAPEEASPAEQAVRPLANLAAQRVILAPSHAVLSQPDPMSWSASLPRSRDLLRQLDDSLASVLGERGLRTQWYYPPDLVRASRANPTYAVDPYSLGVNVLRNPQIASGARLGDPLATQLRTMIALQDARAVLVPVELRFERDAATGQGVAALRVALLDGRLADVRWTGTVRSAPAAAFSGAMLASLASRFADLITAP